MTENNKTNYVLFGDTVIDLAEVVHYKKKFERNQIVLTFVFKSGYTATFNFQDDAAMNSVPTIEQMLGFYTQ